MHQYRVKNKTGDVFEEWAWVYSNFEKKERWVGPDFIMILIDLNIDIRNVNNYIHLYHEAITYKKIISDFTKIFFPVCINTRSERAEFVKNFNLTKDFSVNME